MIDNKINKLAGRNLAVYCALLLLMLVGVLTSNFNPVMVAVLSASLVIFIAFKALNVVRKSVLAVGFLFFGLGVLEINLGFDKGLPVFWVAELALTLFCVAYAFFKALKGVIKGFISPSVNPVGLEPMSHSYNSASGSSKEHPIDDDSFDWGMNGRGGINPIHKEDDPHGLWM